MYKLFTIMILAVTSLTGFAQEWIDATDLYVTNPRFDNNDIQKGWSGTTFSANNPFENAEHFNKNYDTYQKLTGLTAGKYRVSVSAFYRMGTAKNDYTLYSGNNYTGSQNAKLYAKSSTEEKTKSIMSASSAALEYSLGGSASEVSSSNNWGGWGGWGGWNPTYYIPNNMEAAHYWFEEGYYYNELQCTVGNDGALTIGINKDTRIDNDWTCLDNWKLEFYGTITGIQLSETETTLMPHEMKDLTAQSLPYETDYNQSVNWTSSNPKIATVDENGRVVALSKGTAYITAKSKATSSVYTQCKVIVTDVSEIANAIVINEIMASNIDVYMDPSFNYGSWVELYNPSQTSLSLGGFYITDDPNHLKKHKLIDDYGILPAGGFALLNFDHHEVHKAPSYRQIDDKLNVEGGTIIISDGEKIIAQQDYPQAISRSSYCRTNDGGSIWSYNGNPTPGTSNAVNTKFGNTQLEAPIVDKDAQKFTGILQISVNIPTGAMLKYTTDGTTPTLTNGTVSGTGLFQVDKTTCYRFRLFRTGYLPSPVVTRTYLYNDKTYPFPIISVVTNNDNLYSNEYGLFQQSSNGRLGRGQDQIECNWNMDWDRPVSVEIINPNNECIVSQECNFSMCGGWSRAWNPHSFKLKASKTYDFKNFFDAQLFEKKPYIKSKTLQIRNGGNDSQTYNQLGGRIRDAILQQIVARSGINIDYQEWQPVHVLINGKYYATLSMREPNNKHYAYANYGIDTDEMDQFEIEADSGYVQMEGTNEAWLKLIELSQNADNEDTYAEISQLLDIDEYINLMAVELYLGGTDWPHNNVKGFRDRNNGKFRFVLFDLDFAGQTSTPFQNFFSKENFTSAHSLLGYDYSQNKNLTGTRLAGTNTFVTLFRNMLKNNDFRKRFIDMYCIMGGSIMQNKYVKEIANEMRDYMKTGIYNEDRFDPSISSNYVIGKFTASYNSSLVDHMRNRSELGIKTVSKQSVSLSANTQGAKINLNGIELPYTEFEGYLFAPIQLKAIAPAGYEFVGWKDVSNSTENIISEEADYTLPAGTQKLIAIFEKKSDIDIAAEGITPVRINEISAANSMYINDYFKKNDWVELYNTTDQAIDIKGMYISDNMTKPQKYQVLSDDVSLNTIIPARGYKVIWCDKLDNIGSSIHTSFKLASEGGEVVITTDEYADTLSYTNHLGTQSFGRYPDGSNDTYVMNMPTIGKANQTGSADILHVKPVDDPETNDIRSYTKEGSITIAYVDGVINVKSEDDPISSINIYSMSGIKMEASQFSKNGESMISVYVGSLPKGIYIATVNTKNNDECRIKFFKK